jgi:hypothetical protein
VSVTRVGRGLIALAMAGIGTVALGAPAGASLTGPCTAQGLLVQTKQLYLARSTDKVTIPRDGDVKWRVSTPAHGRRVVKGEVKVVFPPPINSITIGEWGQNGKPTDSSSNSGTYHYSFSKLLAGIEIPVTGSSTEPGQIPCVGTVVVTLQGNTPLRWISLVITVFVAMNLGLAMRARKLPPPPPKASK